MDGSSLIALVRAHLPPGEVERAVVYRDPNPLRAGERVGVGQEAPIMQCDGFLLFVDLSPVLNWAHPCLYILVCQEGRDVEVVRASFPPRGRGFPDQFEVIMKFGNEAPVVGASRPGDDLHKKEE